ncbi:MAG: sialidase family protein, partial [Candidatus Andersenbacteria bacterium]
MTGGTAPTVTTSAATNQGTTSATLNGTVNPNGLATTAYFEWGTSNTLATSTATPSQSIAPGTSTVSVTANLTGLSPTTTYYFRVVGQNSAGTQRGSIASYMTMNSDTSWTAVNSGLTNPLVRAFALSGTNLFVGTNGGGVFRSSDNGTSWTAVNTTFSSVFAFAVSGTNLFAGTTNGRVILSSNNGTNWTEVNTNLTVTHVFALAVSGTNLFAGTYGGGVFLSTNNGTSWTATGLTNNFVNSLVVSGTNLFAGTANGIFLSANNGANWIAVNTGLTNTVVQALAVSGTNLFAGTNGGVFRSTNNGTSWTAINTGLTNTSVRALTVFGANLFAGTDGGGVFRSAQSTFAPVVTTDAASPISSTSATLNGSVNPNGLATTAYFEWGTISTLSTFTATSSQSIGLGTSLISVTANLTGLSASTTYYYRMVGQNSAGIQMGSIVGFMTGSVSAPTVTTNNGTNYTTSSATFNGTVNPNGLATTA